VHAPRRRPVALREKVLEELQRMEQMGVIAKQTEPTEWVDSIEPVVTSKKTHICVDPKDLKKRALSSADSRRWSQECRMQSTFLCKTRIKGFGQIKLDDERQEERHFVLARCVDTH